MQKKTPRPTGRPLELTPDKVDRIEKVLEDMIDKADALYEVTLPMLLKRCRVLQCERTVMDALHARGYRFHKLRSKMILTPEDVTDRYKWSKENMDKTRNFWRTKLQISLDNHRFKVALNAKGRKLLSKRKTRGCYRKKGVSLRSGHVKPNPKMHLNTGAPGILKMGGVGAGKVLVFETIKGNWCGSTAANMYKNVVAPALRKQYPRMKSFVALEDNDPTGNRSKLGLAAKAKAKIDLLTIPERSPDLNVMDYNIWSEVERRLRHQERCMKDDKRETRIDFIKRLDRTAKSLTREQINKAIGSLHRRCQLLLKAKGGLFQEGGSKRRPK